MSNEGVSFAVMDSLDIKLLREFLQGEPLLANWSFKPNLTPAFQLLSKKLSVAESTVRARCEKLSRFLSGWALVINPALLGGKIGTLQFEIPANSPKEEILEKLVLVEDMLMIMGCTSHLVNTLFYYPDEFGLKRKIDLIAKLSGCEEHEFSEIQFPKCPITLSMTDLQIIAIRQANAKKSNKEIGDELGISGRTVKRRKTRMAERGAVMSLASLNVDALKDCVYAILTVLFKKPELRTETEKAILAIVDQYLFFYGHFVSYTLLNLILPSVPAGRRILGDVRRLDGVKTARVDFVEERIELYDAFNAQVKRKLAEMRDKRA